MTSVFRKLAKRVTSTNTSISTQGTIPKELTDTQKMFLRWNAERLDISLEESKKRYFNSWSAIRRGHSGANYRAFCDLSYDIFQVLYNDTEREIYSSYKFYGPMHFLRMLSYPEPSWNKTNPVVQHFSDYSTVDIMDYGCGLAQSSRALARYLKAKGIIVNLVLIDIPTIRKDFLLWLGDEQNIKTTFLDCTATSPIPDLPKCDICFATEFFEHVYNPIRYFESIHTSLNSNSLIVTNVSDHRKEFMHVSTNLLNLRDKIRSLKYKELKPNQIFIKDSVHNNSIKSLSEHQQSHTNES